LNNVKGEGLVFGARHKIMTLAGFEVRVDASWFILALLVTWSFATMVLPADVSGLSAAIYWIMGVFAALGLFMSIVLHELAHSLVARSYGMKMNGITLFIFGGVAEMGDEPPSASAEFYMAIAGPIASLVIAAVFKLLALLFSGPAFVAVLSHLAVINLALAVFNMVPAFPLDGGRALRAYLWGRHNDLMRATKTAATIGRRFGVALIILGAILLLAGGGIGALWWGLIGLFVHMIAKAELNRLQTKTVLEGLSVGDLMSSTVETVSPTIMISDFLQNHAYRSFHDMYPVVEEGKLIGAVAVRALSRIPQADWASTPVETAMIGVGKENCISASASAFDAIKHLQENGASRLLVVENGQLIGIIVLKDLLKPLSVHNAVGDV